MLQVNILNLFGQAKILPLISKVTSEKTNRTEILGIPSLKRIFLAARSLWITLLWWSLAIPFAILRIIFTFWLSSRIVVMSNRILSSEIPLQSSITSINCDPFRLRPKVCTIFSCTEIDLILLIFAVYYNNMSYFAICTSWIISESFPLLTLIATGMLFHPTFNYYQEITKYISQLTST